MSQVCQPCSEKLPKDLNKIKIYQLFPRIPYNRYSGRYIKI